jgi:hypothetical protein
VIGKIEEQNSTSKPLGAYLIEAGIISSEQLEIALKKQSHSGKRLGRILVDCGWIKQQTIEYLIEAVVLPHRTANTFSQSRSNGQTNLTLVEQINNYPQITSSSPSSINFFLSPRKTARFLALLVSGLVLISLSLQLCHYFLPDYPLKDSLAAMTNVDGEQNIPSLYSWSALLFAALLLAIIGQVQKAARDRFANHWRLLAFIFVYLSLDEAISIHEKLIYPLRTSLHTGGLLYYAWVIPGAIFVLAVFLGFLKFVNALPPKTKRLFLIAGAVFIGGAIGMELISGAYAEIYTEKNFTSAIFTSIEEFMEMIGIVIFIYALLSYMSLDLRGLDLKIKVADSKKSRQGI